MRTEKDASACLDGSVLNFDAAENLSMCLYYDVPVLREASPAFPILLLYVDATSTSTCNKRMGEEGAAFGCRCSVPMSVLSLTRQVLLSTLALLPARKWRRGGTPVTF